jgi:hypothetical protein
MEQLHKAANYLIEHFETYEEMGEVKNEINKDYFIPILEKICDKISSHESFPEKWVIESPSDADDVILQFILSKIRTFFSEYDRQF